MNPSLAIILATYNAEKELPILLGSLQASTFKDFIICICDDHSQDKTIEVIKNYKKYLHIELTINENNHGVATSRNNARKLTNAELLLFLDADIRLYPDTIEQLLGIMQKNKAPVVQAIYSANALDKSLLSQYYALFIHHSFVSLTGSIYEDNVFNGWCCLCLAKVFDLVGGHTPIAKGIEVENETLGRKIVQAGYKILTVSTIAVDHHWGGVKKLHFIFTSRVYWWVKVFFANHLRFEKALTNSTYGWGTLGIPCFCVTLSLAMLLNLPILSIPGLIGIGLFIYAYTPFYKYVLRMRGGTFSIFAILLSTYFSFIITGAAIYSFFEEILRILFARRTTLSKVLCQ